MKITISEIPELESGSYVAKIKGACDVVTREGIEKMRISLTPFKKGIEYDDVCIWVDSNINTKHIVYKLLEALGNECKTIDTEMFNNDFVGEEVCILVKNKEKDGIIYHNIIDVKSVDEMYEEDEEYDSDEEYDEYDSDDEEYDEYDSDEEDTEMYFSKQKRKRSW